MIKKICSVFIIFLFACNLPKPAAPFILSGKSETVTNKLYIDNDTLVKISFNSTPPKNIYRVLLLAGDSVFKEMYWNKDLKSNEYFYINYPFKPRTEYRILLIPEDFQNHVVLLKNLRFTFAK